MKWPTGKTICTCRSKFDTHQIPLLLTGTSLEQGNLQLYIASDTNGPMDVRSRYIENQL